MAVNKAMGKSMIWSEDQLVWATQTAVLPYLLNFAEIRELREASNGVFGPAPDPEMVSAAIDEEIERAATAVATFLGRTLWFVRGLSESFAPDGTQLTFAEASSRCRRWMTTFMTAAWREPTASSPSPIPWPRALLDLVPEGGLPQAQCLIGTPADGLYPVFLALLENASRWLVNDFLKDMPPERQPVFPSTDRAAVVALSEMVRPTARAAIGRPQDN
jgi:hypothetical protein